MKVFKNNDVSCASVNGLFFWPYKGKFDSKKRVPCHIRISCDCIGIACVGKIFCKRHMDRELNLKRITESEIFLIAFIVKYKT